MKFPAFWKRGKEGSEKYYWALVVSCSRVRAAVWQLSGGVASVVAMGEGVSYGSEEQLLSAVDKSLASAAERFSVEENKEPDEVILGLPAGWVEEDKIVAERLTGLRKVLKELELAPVGFVVTAEAVVHYLAGLEGTGGRMVLVGVDARKIEVGLVTGGKLVGVQTVERSGSVPADVVEGLSRFEVKENMPARMVVYDGGENLLAIRQLLLSHAWQEEKEVKFLHFPKVEVLAGETTVLGVALAGGSELGEGREGERRKETEGEKETDMGKGGEGVSEEEGGLEAEGEVVPVDLVPGELGFVGGDVAEGTKEVGAEGEEQRAESGGMEEEEEGGRGREQGEVMVKKGMEEAIVPGLAEEVVPKERGEFLERRRWWEWEGGKRTVGIILVILVVVLAVAVGAWWYLPSARVSVFVRPLPLAESLTVVLGETGKEGVGVPFSQVTTEVSGKKQMATSGTKLVGDKAHGEVTLYNRVEKSRAIEAGTVIVGPSGLKLSLDSQVNLASASAGTNYEVIPGKATVGVTALDIGANYNLAGGSEFSVGNWAKSDLVGRNEAAFSGGTSREVQAVSEADRERLKASLMEELAGKAKETLAGKLGEGEKLVEGTMAMKDKNVDFSGKVGEEAQELSLDLVVEASGDVVKEADLRKLVEEKVAAKVPGNYEFNPNALEFSFSKKDKEKSFEVVAVAKLVPRFNGEELARRIAGKYPEVARATVAELPGFVRVEFSLKPRLPGKLGTLPHVPGKITIELRPEG